MARNGFAKHYDKLKPAERFSLALEAMARDDETELARLRDSCPRYTYRATDHAYAGRMEASFDIVTAVCADLRVLLGKLHLLRALAESPPNWTAWAEPLARMAFDEGHYCGWAMATGQVDAVNPIEPEAAGDSSTDPARGDPSDGEQSADGAGPDHDPDTKAETDRIADLAERMAQIPAKVLDRLADDLAVELVTQWEAFGRFCRANLELEPMTLLEAWRYPTNDLTGALASYAHTKPDAARAAEYEALLGRAWEHRCLGW